MVVFNGLEVVGLKDFSFFGSEDVKCFIMEFKLKVEDEELVVVKEDGVGDDVKWEVKCCGGSGGR